MPKSINDDIKIEIQTLLNRLTFDRFRSVINDLMNFPIELVAELSLNQINSYSKDNGFQLKENYKFFKLIKDIPNLIDAGFEIFLKRFLNDKMLRGIFYNLGKLDLNLNEESPITLTTILISRELNEEFNKEKMIEICKEQYDRFNGFNRCMIMDEIELMN
jgi:hypothetical protein